MRVLTLYLQFYRLQLLQINDRKQYYTHTRWGRVGEYGQVKTMGPFSLEEALREFEKKFKDKSGLSWDDRSEEPKSNKYTFLEKNYESDDEGDAGTIKQEDDDNDEKTEKAKSELPIQTQRLMELIFNQNHFNSVLEQIGYNADKLPLGKLGKSTLKKGFEHLKELASLIKHPNLAQNKYGISQREVSLPPQFLADGSARVGGRWSPTINGSDLHDHLLFGGSIAANGVTRTGNRGLLEQVLFHHTARIRKGHSATDQQRRHSATRGCHVGHPIRHGGRQCHHESDNRQILRCRERQSTRQTLQRPRHGRDDAPATRLPGVPRVVQILD